MAIHYVLHKNTLTDDPQDYRAVVKSAGTVDLEQVIERMLRRGSTVTRADILAVLENYHGTIDDLVLEGYNVTTPGANYRVGIKGHFDGPTDRFDHRRHQVVARVMPGRRFRRAVKRKARLVKKMALTPVPRPLQYTDVCSETRNSILTVGGLGWLYGARLKFDPADPAQGIFFVPAGDRLWPPSENAIRVESVAENLPEKLIFLVPPLAPGDYRLEVRATVHGSEDVRSGTLDKVLTVSAAGEAADPRVDDSAGVIDAYPDQASRTAPLLPPNS